MPRRSVTIVPGIPHHVTQRAAQGRRILAGDIAKAVLAGLLADLAMRYGVVVHAFVIMNNHFHLVATPLDEGSLRRMIGLATQGLSRWSNVQIGDIGPNWQAPFYAAPMDEEHAACAMRYVERNPVDAGLVSRAWDWPWSSAAYHVGIGSRPALLTDPAAVPLGMSQEDWGNALQQELTDSQVASLKRAESMPTVLADEAWVSRMESILGRRLAPRPRGRPRKAA
jgi:putative transposase